MEFSNFFIKATNIKEGPYEFQYKLVRDPWPDLLDIPTGMGKTAAVVLAWLYKRKILKDPDTPRRLVYCLPMRVLAEQTERNIREWLENLGWYGEAGGGGISVHLLMGGEPDTKSWVEYPEEEMIILGTQDMLLSRALMRGYGMSRYRWPIDFALLHNDAFWVYDEIQLMGPALPTTTQLEAFRRDQQLKPARPHHSLWISATLRPEWLNSIDFRPHLPNLKRQQLSAEEKQSPAILKRYRANKSLKKASTMLDAEGSKKGAASYINALADEIAATHISGTQTLVIVNRVDRAQELYTAVGKRLEDVPRLLLHARFRPLERRAKEQSLRDPIDHNGRIIIATQAIEAGVDISSRTLFTELAPWSSLVQRFGRCNRAGEHDAAQIFWIDISDDAGEHAPYEAEMLTSARNLLEKTTNASPADLPGIDETLPLSQILRRKDFVELFNTDPDLSGFDVDISPYIRDTGTPQLQLFWRAMTEKPVDEAKPEREELCPAGITQIKEHLSKGIAAWYWDGLGGDWRSIDSYRVRPGMILMLRSSDGGYDPELGFKAKSKTAVTPLLSDENDKQEEALDSEPLTAIGRWVPLAEHLEDVASAAGALCKKIDIDGEMTDVITTAALWHDVGKAHPAFQHALITSTKDQSVPNGNEFWAKSAGNGRLQYALQVNGSLVRRPHFRHELASSLAWLAHKESHPHRDLIAYLIAAHHGKVRLGLRALPNENEPKDDRLFARGVWAGDELPSVQIDGEDLPTTTLRLDIMRLGETPDQGESWTTRTRRLLSKYGPFQLAWLETVVRLADWRASRLEMQQK